MDDKNRCIYFDNNSTTPMSKDILDVYLDYSKKYYGNPSSVTSAGRAAKALLITARKEISKFSNCMPAEITFTSGGTESLYSIIQGICDKRSGAILTTSIEHKAVLEAVKSTNKTTTFLKVDDSGIPKLKELENCLLQPAAAIVLSLVNGETGVILPLKEIAELACRYNIPLIIDGVAALGKMEIVLYPGITGMAFSGHKCHGPKGTGFFYLKDKTPFTPLFKGGNQENGKRAGTENVGGILALVAAISSITEERFKYLESLRDYFEEKVKEIFPDSDVNGKGIRITNLSNIYFKDIDGDHLLIYLDQHCVTASLGSACSSGTLEASHVLLGMGYSNRRARSSLRFSFSKENTVEEINLLCDIFKTYKREYCKEMESCLNR